MNSQLSLNRLPNSLAIIPARGGSKGLPRKNVRPLGGIPLIAHTIRAALNSCIERVVVSTDDDEIAEASRQWGAEVPFQRPPEFSGDQATSLSVLLHALDYMMEVEKYPVDHVVYLQPTSPFRRAKHIDEAVQKYLETGAHSLISVTGVQEFHPYFMFTLEESGMLSPLYKMEKRPLRRQDLPRVYRINGAIYISQSGYYQNLPPDAAVFDWNSLSAYVMDAPSSIDINDFLDFKQAEWLLEHQSGDPS
ncbi:MAG: acylneuraminate cytidylyltransferase family protein [Candidatus Omnitrophica bacterium]|nr:acylneuraminate cytidylyltransferase family protein [Candidatus Omnitrophota bacterium]